MLDTIKAHPRLSLLALAGLLVFLTLFKAAFMTELRSQALGKDDINRAALHFAAVEGWGGTDRIAWTVPVEGSEAATVRAAGGVDGAIDRESLPDPAWETSIVTDTGSFGRLFSMDDPPAPMLSLALTPAGEVVQYLEASSPIAGIPIQEREPTSRSYPIDELDTTRIFETRTVDRIAVSAEERERILEIARAFFGRHQIAVDGPPDSFAVKRAQGNKVNAGYMEWRKPGPGNTTEVKRAIVLGDRVAGYDWDLIANVPLPAASIGWEYVRQILAQIAMLLYILVVAFILVLAVLKQRQGEMNLRLTMVVFGIYFLLGIASWISLVGVAAGSQMVVSGYREFWFYLLPTLFVFPILSGASAAMAAGAWAVGESESFVVWPQHLIHPMSAAMRGRFRSSEFVAATVVGVMCAFVGLGTLTLVGLVPQSETPSTLAVSSLSAWPALTLPALGGILMGIQAAIVTCMFAMTYAKRFLRRTWVSILVGTATTWLLVSIRPPFPTNYAVGSILAIGLGLGIATLFVRRGALAVFVAVFTFFAMMSAYPMLLASPHYAVSGVAAMFLALVPLGLAAFASVSPLPEQTTARVPPHIQRALDRLRIGQEFDVARRVQVGLLPHDAPAIPGLDISGTCVPANEVGGDYYDYFRLGGNKVAIAVGDVSGKGVGAAIYMTLTKSYMITQSPRASEPVRVLSRVNSHLKRNLARGTFVTMTYAVVDAEARRLVYARAGHNPPLLLRADGEGDFLNASGLALGSTATPMFEAITKAEEVELNPGDLLILYTDGVTEAMNLVGEEYGEERLVTIVREAGRSRADAAAVTEAILKDVRTFADRAPQHDDITIVVVRVR